MRKLWESIQMSSLEILTETPPKITLTPTQKLKLKAFGRVKIGLIKKPGWKVSLPLYAFNCPRHGLQTAYPQGYNDRLDCPECLFGNNWRLRDLPMVFISVLLGLFLFPLLFLLGFNEELMYDED